MYLRFFLLPKTLAERKLQPSQLRIIYHINSTVNRNANISRSI
jgi:hypothetical protein